LKTYIAVVAGILSAVFLLVGLVKARIAWAERESERQVAEAQHKADLWCQKHNNDPGARYYGNPQYLCAGSDGQWSGDQPDGQLISFDGHAYVGDGVEGANEENQREQAKKQSEEAEEKQFKAHADAWCRTHNGNDPSIHYNNYDMDGDGTCAYPDGTKGSRYAAWQPDEKLLTWDGGNMPEEHMDAKPVDCGTRIRQIFTEGPGDSDTDIGCPAGKAAK
jgi:hypothetical protein